MPRKSTTTIKRPRKVKSDTVPYEVSLTMSGRTFTSNGETIREAILGLKVGSSRGVGVLVVKHGDKQKDKILNPLQIMRVFHLRGTTQEINLKNIINLFEGI